MLRLDLPRLLSMASQNRAAFDVARPFRHCVIDGFLDGSRYSQVRGCFPPDDDVIWKKPENRNTMGKRVTRRGPHGLKETLYDDRAYGVLTAFNSSVFLRFLEELTGIPGVLGDPYFCEAGFHASDNGGFLGIHADFSHHDILGLERRLNVILFLNDDWRHEYGGALQFYDQNLYPVQWIYPFGNRLVVFETSEASFHGHPCPMDLPPGQSRKSLAFYYYTLPTGRPKTPVLFPADPEFVQTATVE